MADAARALPPRRAVAGAYWHWLTSALHGDLGDSIALRESVNTLIGERAGVTLELVLYASVLILLLGDRARASLAGLRRGRARHDGDRGHDRVRGDPVVRRGDRADQRLRRQAGLVPGARRRRRACVDRFWHLTLPAIALALSALAIVARVTRVAVREEMGREHVQTAISRGLPSPLVVRRHVLRNAAIPITTVIGITIASLIALSAVVERAFSLNGLGAALVQRGAVEGLRRRAGDLADPRGGVRHHERGRRPALRGARPAGRAREPGRMSTVAARPRPGGRRAPPRARVAGSDKRRRRLPRRDRARARWPRSSAPLLAPHDPNAVEPQQRVRRARSRATCSGFDGQGRDLLSRLLAGARTSIARARSPSSLLSMVAGVVLAIVAAWRGGWLDSVDLDRAGHPVRVPRRSCSPCSPRPCSARA